MSLGVLNNISAIYAENNLNQTSASLQNTLTQLSSGSRINSGADDAAGHSLADGLGANSAALTQSATNASSGVGLLQVADGALSQVTNLLNRAVTLATEASNGTLNSSQDAAANQEYQSILAEVNNIGSTSSYNGVAVFGSSTAIFTGDASAIGSSVDTLNIKSLTSNSVGDVGGVIGSATTANVETGSGRLLKIEMPGVRGLNGSRYAGHPGGLWFHEYAHHCQWFDRRRYCLDHQRRKHQRCLRNRTNGGWILQPGGLFYRWGVLHFYSLCYWHCPDLHRQRRRSCQRYLVHHRNRAESEHNRPQQFHRCANGADGDQQCDFRRGRPTRLPGIADQYTELCGEC